MLSQLLRHFLFTFIHVLVNLILLVQNVYNLFLVKKEKLFKDSVSEEDITVIIKHLPKFQKTLKHVVMLADLDKHSMSELALLVIWSLVAGIQYISFHDITGQLKKQEENFFMEVEKCKKGIPGCIKWSSKPDLNGYTNGGQAHTVNVNIFTRDDGRPKIVQCIQKIVQGEIVCKRSSKEFTAQELDEAIKIVYSSFPDPDLVLYTGELCCTYGLLPWHIRLTEFIQLSPTHSIPMHRFIGALGQYNNCNQRFGK